MTGQVISNKEGKYKKTPEDFDDYKKNEIGSQFPDDYEMAIEAKDPPNLGDFTNNIEIKVEWTDKRMTDGKDMIQLNANYPALPTGASC